MTETATRPLPSFSTLRELARSNPVAHACVKYRSAQVRSAGWDILPASRASAERRATAIRFFRNPDPEYGSWGAWAEVAATEILETDSLALHVRHTAGPGKGLFGSDVAALEILDGATIEPALGLLGERAGYRQYLHEVRRRGATEIALEPTPGELHAWEETGRLIVAPFRSRRGSPFGLSPVEDAIAYGDDDLIDMPATEAATPTAFGLSRRELGLPGDDGRPAFPLDEQIRAHLKGIFDSVLQDLCGAADLEWTWRKDGA